MTVEGLIEKWKAESERLAAEGHSVYRGDMQRGDELFVRSDAIDAVLDDLRKLVKPLPEAMPGYQWEPISVSNYDEWVNVAGAKDIDFVAYGNDFGLVALYDNGALVEHEIPYADITHVARPVRDF